MCGVVGILSKQPVADRLISCLSRLEYRGYDSSGIAVVDGNEIKRLRQPGKLSVLQRLYDQQPIDGYIGIAHTRWATHGLPTENNAHPHVTDRVALVHNGIIENHTILKNELINKGYTFDSQTDSEVALKLLDDFLQQGLQPLAAVQQLIKVVKGSYAFIFIFKDYPNLMIGTRCKSPLIIGQAGDDYFLGSDTLALGNCATQIAYLEEQDIAVIKPEGLQIYNHLGNRAQRDLVDCPPLNSVLKGRFPHFMLKEIFDQPDVIRMALSSCTTLDRSSIQFNQFKYDFKQADRIIIVACGSSYYAALVAKYWLEQIAHITCDIDIASEFRYRQPPLVKGNLAIFISQSGETADTLAAHQYAKSCHQKTLAIINVANSTLDRDADYTILTQAGPEIGVASTKAFTTQLTVLACLALQAAKQRGAISQAQYADHLDSLFKLPYLIDKILEDQAVYQHIATHLRECRDVLYLGRGTSYAIALEGALKLKEISYIHAEGYAAGEMKHGPIALIDDKVPIIVLAPNDDVYEKTLSNIQEAAARKGKIILITDKVSNLFRDSLLSELVLPTSSPLISPILYTIPVQLIAYYTAIIKGTDVDQPRNLAKSVTVE